MPKKTVKAPKKESKKDSEYVVTFHYNGKDEVLKGDDFLKLFAEWTPRVFKTIVLLTAEHGKVKLQRRLPIMQAKRIAGNYKFASIFAHNLLKFLG